MEMCVVIFFYLFKKNFFFFFVMEMFWSAVCVWKAGAKFSSILPKYIFKYL